MRADYATRPNTGFTGLFLLLLCHGCAPAPEAPPQQVDVQAQAMMNEGEDGVNCNTCAGGECAELHCFERWVQGGGGGDGPYTGPSGPGGGSWDDEPDHPGDGEYKCTVECTGDYYRCMSLCDNPYSQPAGELCKQDCAAALDVCFEVCKARNPLQR